MGSHKVGIHLLYMTHLWQQHPGSDHNNVCRSTCLQLHLAAYITTCCPCYRPLNHKRYCAGTSYTCCSLGVTTVLMLLYGLSDAPPMSYTWSFQSDLHFLGNLFHGRLIPAYSVSRPNLQVSH